MRYGSVCSGIEAATVAWEPLGWHAAFYSEIDKAASALLRWHYPTVPNLGDMTQFQEWPDDAIDLLVGGTPCQSFSVAGLRAGLADPRGNLMLTYLAIAAKYRPRWVVWENVPGVLSSGKGRDFAALLGGLVELGYGFAYRVLDAQFCRTLGFAGAVPQRRRRVFVVGHLGDWRRAAAVLFDAASLRGDSSPSRQAGKGVAADVAPSLVSSGRGTERTGDTRGQDPVIAVPPVSVTLTARDRKGPLPEADLSTVVVSHALRAEGFDAGEDGTGRGTPIVPVAFDSKDMSLGHNGATGTLTTNGDQPGKAGGRLAIATPWIVRRLTPTECERLQGFPDGYTNVPRGNKPTPDGPRYKQLGNSMAVNVMRVLGQRIAMVDALP